MNRVECEFARMGETGPDPAHHVLGVGGSGAVWCLAESAVSQTRREGRCHGSAFAMNSLLWGEKNRN